jgi:hypothetical protein
MEKDLGGVHTYRNKNGFQRGCVRVFIMREKKKNLLAVWLF